MRDRQRRLTQLTLDTNAIGVLASHLDHFTDCTPATTEGARRQLRQLAERSIGTLTDALAAFAPLETPESDAGDAGAAVRQPDAGKPQCPDRVRTFASNPLFKGLPTPALPCLENRVRPGFCICCDQPMLGGLTVAAPTAPLHVTPCKGCAFCKRDWEPHCPARLKKFLEVVGFPDAVPTRPLPCLESIERPGFCSNCLMPMPNR